MLDETYTVRYVCDATAAIHQIHQLQAAIRSLDAQVEQSKKNLSGFAGGGARSAANATKKINDLVTALNGVPPSIGSAGS